MVYQNKIRKNKAIHLLLKVIDHGLRQGHDSTRLSNDIYDQVLEVLLEEQKDYFEQLEFLRTDDVPN